MGANAPPWREKKRFWGGGVSCKCTPVGEGESHFYWAAEEGAAV